MNAHIYIRTKYVNNYSVYYNNNSILPEYQVYVSPPGRLHTTINSPVYIGGAYVVRSKLYSSSSSGGHYVRAGMCVHSSSSAMTFFTTTTFHAGQALLTATYGQHAYIRTCRTSNTSNTHTKTIHTTRIFRSDRGYTASSSALDPLVVDACMYVHAFVIMLAQGLYYVPSPAGCSNLNIYMDNMHAHRTCNTSDTRCSYKTC